MKREYIYFRCDSPDWYTEKYGPETKFYIVKKDFWEENFCFEEYWSSENDKDFMDIFPLILGEPVFFEISQGEFHFGGCPDKGEGLLQKAGFIKVDQKQIENLFDPF